MFLRVCLCVGALCMYRGCARCVVIDTQYDQRAVDVFFFKVSRSAPSVLPYADDTEKEGDAWSMVKQLQVRQATNEYPSPREILPSNGRQ